MAYLHRNKLIKKLNEVKYWDFIIIGGGATGLGIALDAASRGYSTLLLEQSDFAKGTSSRSTKLIHGGVRYLAQGNVQLVYEALHERGILLRNAPHLVKPQGFVIPCYSWFEKLKYFVGLKLYDWLSGSLSLGKSVSLNRNEIGERLPNIVTEALVGGIHYYDAQFDDARLAINLAQTAAEHGAVVLNYFKVTSVLKEENKVCGVTTTDVLTNKNYALHAKLVVNATGVFVNDILKLDLFTTTPVVRPSQGIHLVLNKSFLKSTDALLIPKTSDKRVLFLLPWHHHVLIGTTDTPVDCTSMEPIALEEEINFILETARHYLSKPPAKKDVLSVFAGLRPLAVANHSHKSTKEISRGHKVFISNSGLVTITGGKWTTYRKMAEDVVNKAIAIAGLKKRKCKTKEIRIHGYVQAATTSFYGSDEEKINQLIEQNPLWGENLLEQFPFKKAHVVWAVENEMAMTVEDILARRFRILFLDARAAMTVAPAVAAVMAKQLNYDEQWIKTQVETFNELAQQYLINHK